jgi:hypothetical protein
MVHPTMLFTPDMSIVKSAVSSSPSGTPCSFQSIDRKDLIASGVALGVFAWPCYPRNRCWRSSPAVDHSRDWPQLCTSNLSTTSSTQTASVCCYSILLSAVACFTEACRHTQVTPPHTVSVPTRVSTSAYLARHLSPAGASWPGRQQMGVFATGCSCRWAPRFRQRGMLVVALIAMLLLKESQGV